MTAILGFIDEKKTYMVCDSQVTTWYKKGNLVDSKIFEKEEFLIGAAGKLKTINALDCWECPERKKSESLDSYIRISVRRSLRELFEREEVAGVADGKLKSTESDILIITNEGVYYIDPGLAIYRVDQNYGAIGSGDLVCEGAIGFYEKFRDHFTDLKVEDIMRAAIRLSSQTVEGVNDNIKILTRNKK